MGGPTMTSESRTMQLIELLLAIWVDTDARLWEQ